MDALYLSMILLLFLMVRGLSCGASMLHCFCRWFQMTDRLPRELQLKICSYISTSDFLPVHQSQILPLGLTSREAWRNVNLDKLNEIDSDFLTLFRQFIQFVKKLVWQSSEWKGDTDVHEICRGLCDIEILDLSYNEQLYDYAFLHNCSKLKELFVASCDIPRNLISVVLPTLTNLTSLDVSECDITETSIDHALTQLQHLKKLNIRGCFSMNINKVTQLARTLDRLEFCPRLQRFSLRAWVAVVRNHSNLCMCPAEREILEESLNKF